MIQIPVIGDFNMPSKATAKKIARLDNQYTQKQLETVQQEQKTLIYRRRRIAVIFAVAMVFFVAMGINLATSYQKIHRLKRERQVVLTEQQEVTNQITQLKQDVSLLQDEEYLEKLARAKYFYTKEGELIYSVPQNQQVTTQKSQGLDEHELQSVK